MDLKKKKSNDGHDEGKSDLAFAAFLPCRFFLEICFSSFIIL